MQLPVELSRLLLPIEAVKVAKLEEKLIAF